MTCLLCAANLAGDLHAQGMTDGREALEEAAGVLGDYSQGTLEMVNSGDALLSELLPELKKYECIARAIRALAAKEDGK